MASHPKFPALHNAMWPGLVGKGGPGAEPPIDLVTMLNLTAAARANGARFDGVDLFLFDPHVSIDSTDDDLKRLADKIGAKGLVVGSLVALVWPPTGGGSAMGGNGDRGAFLSQVRKACAIGKKLKDLGIRRYGIVRIDSAAGPSDWAADPAGNTTKIADTFYRRRTSPRSTATAGGRRRDLLGRHAGVKRNVELLQAVGRPGVVGSRRTAHTLLFTMGYAAPDDRISGTLTGRIKPPSTRAEADARCGIGPDFTSAKRGL
jgi:hypothetical protein